MATPSGQYSKTFYSLKFETIPEIPIYECTKAFQNNTYKKCQSLKILYLLLNRDVYEWILKNSSQISSYDSIMALLDPCHRSKLPDGRA